MARNASALFGSMSKNFESIYLTMKILFSKYIALFILGLAFLSIPINLRAKADHPNIIFILTDDLGYGDVGVLFQKQREGVQLKTPELDQMAEMVVI